MLFKPCAVGVATRVVPHSGIVVDCGMWTDRQAIGTIMNVGDTFQLQLNSLFSVATARA